MDWQSEHTPWRNHYKEEEIMQSTTTTVKSFIFVGVKFSRFLVKRNYFNSNQLQLKNNMNNTHLLRGIYLLGFIFIFACPWNQRNLEPNKYWWIHNTQGWSAIASDYQGERTLAVKNTCKFIVKRQERLFIPGSQLEVCKLTLH